MTTRARRARGELGARHIEALAVAMIVAPGVYARNRMFDFFSSAGVQRARTRASIVRGIVKELPRATSLTLSAETRGFERTFVLRYAVVALRLTRVVQLSPAELAALRLVAERAGVRVLPPDPSDKELVASALARLLDAEVATEEGAHLAREIAARPLAD